MNRKTNLYFAAILGAMTPMGSVSALAASSHSLIALGEPIIGATIRVEGSNGGGTVTDIDGNFTLNDLPKGTKLTITSIGYKAQSITWTGGPINITMQDDSNMLEETVVVGYGVQKKPTSQVLFPLSPPKTSKEFL